MNYKFDGSKVFFTSDTHFYHGNIIRFCNRPFEDVEMMNETIISNWNNTVGLDDTVFHLGDFCLGGSAEWTKILDSDSNISSVYPLLYASAWSHAQTYRHTPASSSLNHGCRESDISCHSIYQEF